MQDMIMEYEMTRNQLVRKIEAITAEMGKIKRRFNGYYQNETSFVRLSSRREKLYDMLLDIEFSIKQMKEYQAATMARQAS